MDFPLRFHGVRLEGQGEVVLKCGLTFVLDMIAKVTGYRAAVTKLVPERVTPLGLKDAVKAGRDGDSLVYVDVWFYFDDELWALMNDEALAEKFEDTLPVDPDYEPKAGPRVEPPPFRIVGGASR